MSNFDLSALALAGMCPGNELLYDDVGMPSVMVKIPKLTYAQLGMGESAATHPAFIVNGREVDAIWISKYQNIVQNGRAYSLPAQAPKITIDFDTAKAACDAKGSGWHIMTRMEWGVLVQWCEQNGIIPLGNNNFGKHSTEKSYKAIPAAKQEDGQTSLTCTGTGPLTWYHDQSPAGIADLCGNAWEWSGGIRIVHGELQILINNNAADSDYSQDGSSAEWKAILASTGEPVMPDGSGTTPGTIKMDWVGETLTYSDTLTDVAKGTHSCNFSKIVASESVSEAAKIILQSLGMMPYTGKDLCASHFCLFNNDNAECFLYSGGRYHLSNTGMASFYVSDARNFKSPGVGFRAAFVELPTD